MTTLSPQDPNHPAPGGFVQPAPGVTAAGVVQYRDTNETVQVAAKVAAPAAGAAVATLTAPPAGLYAISGTVSAGGTTVAAADSHNMNLKAGSTTLLTNIPMGVAGTSGMDGAAPFGPVIVTLDGATDVTVNAVGNSTASSSYAAQIIATLVG